MTDKVETTEPKVEKPLTDVPEAEADGAEDPKALKEQLESARKKLKEVNHESAERRKRLEELEKAEADRKTAEMTEAEKAQARIKELEAKATEAETKVKQAERRDLQRKVADAVGLPSVFASRLVGETEEEMTADAKAIAEALPKSNTNKVAPRLNATNPADGKQGETVAQKKERYGLNRQGVNVWDPELNKALGGGFSIGPTKED